MAVTHTNNWKNILDKLQNVLRSEFKGALPVYKGQKQQAGTRFLRLIPIGSELSTYNINGEIREFTVNMELYFNESNIKDTALDEILRMVSRIEALIHDNITMTLADPNNSSAFNCRIESTELNAAEGEELYLVVFEWKCQHQGNLD
tara:strand:- start:199 stop:639 length:441 start_codon:yes stop_codon:yes gene_type:complete